MNPGEIVCIAPGKNDLHSFAGRKDIIVFVATVEGAADLYHCRAVELPTAKNSNIVFTAIAGVGLMTRTGDPVVIGGGDLAVFDIGEGEVGVLHHKARLESDSQPARCRRLHGELNVVFRSPPAETETLLSYLLEPIIRT